MSKEIILDGVEEVDLLEEQKNQSGTFGTTILIDDAPEQPKKEKQRGPKKRRKDTTIKTFNLDDEVIEKIEAYCEEHEISASIFVNRVLKKEFGL